MSGDEIEIPKNLIQFLPEGTEETNLGQKNGAKKQYRYGNLHIREYDDKFLVHTDKMDPRTDPLGHLVFDAPEILVGLACAAFSGEKVSTYLYKNNKNSIFSKQFSVLSGVAAAVAFGYIGYSLTKILKKD